MLTPAAPPGDTLQVLKMVAGLLRSGRAGSPSDPQVHAMLAAAKEHLSHLEAMRRLFGQVGVLLWWSTWPARLHQQFGQVGGQLWWSRVASAVWANGLYVVGMTFHASQCSWVLRDCCVLCQAIGQAVGGCHVTGVKHWISYSGSCFSALALPEGRHLHNPGVDGNMHMV